VSPLGMAIFPFTDVLYLSQTYLGVISWEGKLTSLDEHKDRKIYRICTLIRDTLYNVAFIAEGLTPSGVDVFETYQSMRMVNKSQPKTQF
jgi:hypothetical protein